MFAFPFFLWFLPLIGLVVLIHLINMFRHRRVEWAAMEFLLAAYRKSRIRILFQQLLLMLLRTAAIVSAILMIAQPKWDGVITGWLGAKATHHIVLLDDSFSMNDRDLSQGGSLLFDDALIVLQRIVENVENRKLNDRLTLIRLSKVHKILAGSEPDVADLYLDETGIQIVRDFLSTLKVSQQANDPADLFDAALSFVRRSQGRSKSVVYFISDFRQRNWSESASILKKIDELRHAGASFRMLRSTDNHHGNLAIRRLNPVEGIHAADIDLFLDASVVNYGPEDAENVQVLLRVNDRTLPSLSIPKIKSGEETVPPIRFPVRLDGPGYHRVEAQIQGDSVSADNYRFLVLNIPASLEILLIADPDSITASDSPVPYLRAALSPGGTRSGIKTRVVPPSFLSENPLESFSAIFLLDVSKLEQTEILALEDYVKHGGGLAVFVGPKTDPQTIDRELYRNGQGLFPFGAVGSAVLEADYLSRTPDIDQIDEHPIFRLFESGDRSLLSRVKIERYFAVRNQSQSTAENENIPNNADVQPNVQNNVRILASLRGGMPLIAEKQFGAGKSMTFLTSVSPVWNNWARGNPGFVVMMLELAAYLSRRNDDNVQQFVGQPILLSVDTAQYEANVQIRRPVDANDSSSSAVSAAEGVLSNGTATIAINDTTQAGFYEAVLKEHSGAESIQVYAVNVDAAEGDTRLADVSALAASFREANLSLESAAGFSVSFDLGGKRPWSDLFLALLVLLLLVEVLLAGRILPPNKQAA